MPERMELTDTILSALSDVGELVVIVRGDDGDATPRIAYLSEPVLVLVGRRREELPDIASLLALLPEGHRARVRDLVRFASVTGDRFETAFRRSDGSAAYVELAAKRYDVPGAWWLVVIGRDVSERKRTERALEDLALHDQLTGFPNRVLFQDRLTQLLLEARRSDRRFGLLLLDLDHFREVNDTFGHPTGDALLREVSRRIRDGVRESDSVGRMGGDEFAVLLPDADEIGAIRVAESIREELARPHPVGSGTIGVEASIGIALHPEDDGDPATLLRHADVAMYVAKRSGAGYATYRPEHDVHSARRLTLLSDLRRAIAADELVVHYQPTVQIASGHPAGAEALLRWRHPRHGLVPPAEFIPLAEQSGLIRPLTEWVLRRAVHERLDWCLATHGSLSVAVNLPARTLLDPRLPDLLVEILTPLPPGALVLEITESTLMADPDGAREALGRARELGARVAIDDFGTGYSSLSYLLRLPVDQIKIDRSFVVGMRADAATARIVRAILDLAHDLGFPVLAEGVEDEATLDQLRAMGCDLAQGHLFARAMPSDQLAEWLRAG